MEAVHNEDFQHGGNAWKPNPPQAKFAERSTITIRQPPVTVQRFANGARTSAERPPPKHFIATYILGSPTCNFAIASAKALPIGAMILAAPR